LARHDDSVAVNDSIIKGTVVASLQHQEPSPVELQIEQTDDGEHLHKVNQKNSVPADDYDVRRPSDIPNDNQCVPVIDEADIVDSANYMIRLMADGEIVSSDSNAMMFHVIVERLLGSSDDADREECLVDNTARNQTTDDDESGQG